MNCYYFIIFLFFSLLIINIKFESIHTSENINNYNSEDNHDTKIYLDGNNQSHLIWFIQVYIYTYL